MQKLDNLYLGPISISGESSDAGQGARDLCPSSPRVEDEDTLEV